MRFDGANSSVTSRAGLLFERYLSEFDAGQPTDRQALLAEAGPAAGQLQAFFDLHDTVMHAVPPTTGPRVGRWLGSYELGEELSTGLTCSVYKALRVRDGQASAVKVLMPGRHTHEVTIRRFRREAELVELINHPNVLPIEEFGEDNGVLYYAMPFVRGGTLGDLIDRIKRQAEPWGDWEAGVREAHASRYRAAARLGAAAARALHAAHQVGVIHRDVKPGNLLLDVDGTVYLADFGLAHVVDQEGGTATGALLGSIGYMAPEQTQSMGPLLDARTDVYSLGVSLLELITLQRAYRGLADWTSYVRWLVDGEVPLARSLREDVPRDLGEIIRKATAKRPEDRYRTALLLADDLERFGNGQPVLARPPSLAKRLGRTLHRHRLAAGVGLAVALVSWGVSTVLLTSAYRSARVDRDDLQSILYDFFSELDSLGNLTNSNDPNVQRNRLTNLLRIYDAMLSRGRPGPPERHTAAALYQRLGVVSSLAGDPACGQAAYTKARDLYAELAREFPDKGIYQLEYGRCCGSIREDTASDHWAGLRQFADIAGNLHRREPHNPDWQDAFVSSTLDCLRGAPDKPDRLPQAMSLVSKADDLVKRFPTKWSYWHNSGRSRVMVAEMMVEPDLSCAAIALAVEGLGYLEGGAKLCRGDVDREPALMETADAFTKVAAIQMHCGRHSDALLTLVRIGRLIDDYNRQQPAERLVDRHALIRFLRSESECAMDRREEARASFRRVEAHVRARAAAADDEIKLVEALWWCVASSLADRATIVLELLPAPQTPAGRELYAAALARVGETTAAADTARAIDVPLTQWRPHHLAILARALDEVGDTTTAQRYRETARQLGPARKTPAEIAAERSMSE